MKLISRFFGWWNRLLGITSEEIEDVKQDMRIW